MLLEIPEQALINETNKILRKKYTKQSSASEEIITETDYQSFTPTEKKDASNTKLLYHEKEVIRLLIKYADNDIIVKIKSEDQLENREIPVVTYILHALLGDEIEFITPEYQEILMLFNDLLKEETTSEKLKEKIIALQKSLPHHEKSSIRKTAIDIYSEDNKEVLNDWGKHNICLLYTSPSPRDS